MDFLLTLTNRSGLVDSTIAPASDAAIQANAAPLAFIGLLMLTILTGSLFLWSKFIVAYVKGVPFFPDLEPRQIQRWALTDIVMALASLYLVSTLAASVATRIGVERADLVDGSASSLPKVAIATFQLSAIALMTFLIAVRYRITVGQIGWSTKHILKDIRFGILAFVMALPPIYVLMIASTLLFKKPYNHPVVDAIKNDPSSLPMAIWLAVVIAPLLEEFGFRVLLQGFLESLSRGPLSLKLIFSGRRGDSPIVATESVSDDFTPHTGVSASWGEKPVNPYEVGTNNLMTSSLSPTDVSQAEASPDMVIRSEQLPWWPVIVSGVLFGLAHFDYGASWLPLAALGIVLGYLYRVTNRIWPSLVVHCCLNGMTMLNLTLLTLYGDPSKIP